MAAGSEQGRQRVGVSGGATDRRARSSSASTTRLVRLVLNRVLLVVALPLTLIVVSIVSRISAQGGARVARGGVAAIARLCGVRFADEGSTVLGARGSFIVVANHSSPLDIAALLWSVPNIRFLAAADLFRVPLLASAMRGMRTIPIDRRDRQTARRQIDALVDTVAAMTEVKLVIFPEGGIPPLGRRLPFKAGAFELAIRTAVPVLPVAIHGSDAALPPKGRLGVRPGTVRIEGLAPIVTEGRTMEDLDALRAEAETAIVAALAAGA